jgi:hypothetical protein
MTKKEMQAFMKAKLAKTKIQDSAVSGVAAVGPTAKHFKPTLKKEESESVKYIPRVAAQPEKPSAVKSAPKQHPVQLDLPDDDTEMAAANAAMMAKSKIGAGKGTMLYADSHRGGEYEERKTTVINVSKNIYKPSFNLPPKDDQFSNPARSVKQAAKTKAADKTPIRQSDKQPERVASKTGLRSDKNEKIYSKPNLSSANLLNREKKEVQKEIPKEKKKEKKKEGKEQEKKV